jgi:hypothetical protein
MTRSVVGPLSWHTYVPHELSIKELDHAGWAEYLEAENAILDSENGGTEKLALRIALPPIAISKESDLPWAFCARLESFLCA